MKNTLKGLSVISVLALLLTGCGGIGDSKDEPLAATPTATTPVPTPETTETTVAAPATIVVKAEARIDAASFLDALVASGCDIDKAEYKEVIRGGGISVTCTKAKDALDTEGLDAL